MSDYYISKKESISINILKVVLTIFVVFIHSDLTRNDNMNFNGSVITLNIPMWLNTFKYFISTIICGCANNCFFFIASILLYRKEIDYIDNLKKKTKSLVLPYFIANTIIVILYAIFSAIPFTKVYFSNQFFNNEYFDIYQFLQLYGIFSKGTLNGPLWFLRNLFILNILSILIKRIIDKFPKTTLLLLFANAILNKFNFFFLIYPDNLLFWCLGYYFVKNNIHISQITNKKSIISVSYMTVIIFLLLLYVKQNVLNIYIINFINLIRDFLSFLFWYMIIDNNTNNRLCLFLNNLSKYSFMVYLFHGVILLFANKVLLRVLPNNPFVMLLEYLLLVPITIILIVILNRIINKYFPFISKVLSGFRN